MHLKTETTDMDSSSTTSSGPSEPDDEILIKVNGISKKFCRDLKKSLWYGISDIATELNPLSKNKSRDASTPGTLRPGEFWANRNVSFQLRRGECLGLIGKNGAGKTTLLKMLNGLIKPDEGSIEIKGRVGALIALGAGFNPILTGRENIYINASILGISKAEVDEKIDDIIDFAEVHEFIDSPVQSYSSGMQVRLGFAVASSIDPDVLILDEVLAVGDASFRAKCYRRISEIRKKAAIIFVSHNMQQVAKISNRGLLLRPGTSEYSDDVAETIRGYFTVAGADSPTKKRNEAGYDLDVSPSEINWDFVKERPEPVRLDFSYKGPGGDYSVSLSVMDEAENVIAHQIQDITLAEDGSFFVTLDPLATRTGKSKITVCIYGRNNFISPLVWFENCVWIHVQNDPRLAGTFALAFQAATE
jgi:ABC-type polysaccharide/polyol phosphate transport system ATPase subunit